jgi:hypothetical protein
MTPEQVHAVATRDCPFCGAKAGTMCVRVEATYDPPLPGLLQPHPNRMPHPDEADELPHLWPGKHTGGQM